MIHWLLQKSKKRNGKKKERKSTKNKKGVVNASHTPLYPSLAFFNLIHTLEREVDKVC